MTNKARGLWIGEAAKRTGVSVRTLRHYDDIGLLSPSGETDAGYRLYDVPAMRRLEQILYFRELGFELGEIREMMDHPAYDEREALRRKRELLEIKRRQLDAVISRIDDALAEGAAELLEVMTMNDYEKTKKQYAEEVRQRWGSTDAYRESERREKGRTKEQGQAIADGMQDLMQVFADVRTLDPADARAQALVERWQAYITAHFYPCTDEILAGLGRMYTADERFMQNIDRCGEGTADFMSRAIAAYCAARRG